MRCPGRVPWEVEQLDFAVSDRGSAWMPVDLARMWHATPCLQPCGSPWSSPLIWRGIAAEWPSMTGSGLTVWPGRGPDRSAIA